MDKLLQPAGMLFVLAILLSGCGQDETLVSPKKSAASSEAVAAFDSKNTGSISGQMKWEGEIPIPEIVETIPNSQAGELLQKKQRRSIPNQPRIDSSTRGVGNAVVFLRGVPPSKCKPWQHGPVRIEQRDGEYHILQDGVDSPFGFVRRGESVTMVSRDRFFYSLHADGAAYFSMMFPEPDQPAERSLKKNGIVELTSGAGYFWMRAYLFVDEHPYYTRTDEQGHFSLEEVPPGQYELICWLPSWKKAGHDRDPESGNVFRLRLREPTEIRRHVEVRSDRNADAQFQFKN